MIENPIQPPRTEQHDRLSRMPCQLNNLQGAAESPASTKSPRIIILGFVFVEVSGVKEINWIGDLVKKIN